MKFTEAIHDATQFILRTQPESYVIGLGVSYPNGADGTMGNLHLEFPGRIIDTPVSEAAVTGVAIGSAIMGRRPIVHHGRVEFALFAADQIITQASKWNYMFGGDYNVPITIRIAVGRQWGNGPQHTQALYSLFGNITGLKVVIPSSPASAKKLLIGACLDPNPVIFLEPRWLYQLQGNVPQDFTPMPLDKARILKTGQDVTLVSYGDGLLPTFQAATDLGKFGISAEVIDLVSINPIDHSTISKSLTKTNKLLTIDTTNDAFSIGSEIIAKQLQNLQTDRSIFARSIATPNVPCPTATSLTEEYYPTRSRILNEVLSIFGMPRVVGTENFDDLHLAPKIECPYE
jgi:pyruvate/2-oxoglutarate/acetoin dehydrogenase E1 component